MGRSAAPPSPWPRLSPGSPTCTPSAKCRGGSCRVAVSPKEVSFPAGSACWPPFRPQEPGHHPRTAAGLSPEGRDAAVAGAGLSGSASRACLTGMHIAYGAREQLRRRLEPRWRGQHRPVKPDRSTRHLSVTPGILQIAHDRPRSRRVRSRSPPPDANAWGGGMVLAFTTLGTRNIPGSSGCGWSLGREMGQT